VSKRHLDALSRGLHVWGGARQARAEAFRSICAVV
jgi:hypothetical protein